MTVNYRKLREKRFDDIVQRYGIKDSILYHLGLNIGSDPVDERELRYVYERELVALPSLCTILGHPANWMRDPELGFDWPRMVHAEQSFEMSSPLPAVGSLTATNRVVDLYDRGEGRGALLVLERELFDAGSRARIARLESIVFARGDGGFGGPPPPDRQAATMPARAPDAVVNLPTLPQSALLYRLNADMNPLHADPKVAREAGFERPILHGLCTYGMSCRALVERVCDGDPARLTAMRARFTAYVLPGETLRIEIWREGPSKVLFRTLVPERGSIALDHGTATCSR